MYNRPTSSHLLHVVPIRLFHVEVPPENIKMRRILYPKKFGKCFRRWVSIIGDHCVSTLPPDG